MCRSVKSPQTRLETKVNKREKKSTRFRLVNARLYGREHWSDPSDMPSTTAEDSQDFDQKHLRCTIVGPDSSYSPFEIHICWKVDKEDKINPPIQTEYLRSGGATTLIFMVEGAKAVSSFVIRSPIPVNMVVPPESTTLE